MASTTIRLSGLKAGYFIAWTITSQCGNMAKVELYDGNRLFVTANKNNHDWNFQMLEQGHTTISTGDIKAVITIHEAKTELQNSKSANMIMDNSGNPVGYVHDICVEDDYDEDYNDIYINVVGWLKKG